MKRKVVIKIVVAFLLISNFLNIFFVLNSFPKRKWSRSDGMLRINGVSIDYSTGPIQEKYYVLSAFKYTKKTINKPQTKYVFITNKGFMEICNPNFGEGTVLYIKTLTSRGTVQTLSI